MSLVKVTNVTELRDQLLDVFNGLRNQTIDPKDAYEINNTAKQVISTAKTQLAYHSLRRELPQIPFLDTK